MIRIKAFSRKQPMLQLALDMTHIDEALQVTEQVAPYFEILEIGTPLILAEGARAIKLLKTIYPHKIILADMKIADAGEYEASIAFEAGADIVSVLGLAAPQTIMGAVKAGCRYQGGVFVDSLYMKDLPERTVQFETMGVTGVLLHAGTDEIQNATSLESQLTEIASRLNIPVAVAGGINIRNIETLSKTGASIFVIGSGVTRDPEPEQTAKDIRAKVLGGAAG